jgi:hypothetical protein
VNADNPGVWVFPKILVCLDCGFSQFSVAESDVALLARGTGIKKSLSPVELTIPHPPGGIALLILKGDKDTPLVGFSDGIQQVCDDKGFKDVSKCTGPKSRINEIRVTMDRQEYDF